MNQLTTQLEAAFHYRGNVTLNLKNGESVECFLFNREFETAKPFIEIFLAGTGNQQKYLLSEVADVQLIGEDHAAGKSYQEWLAKEEKAAPQ